MGVSTQILTLTLFLAFLPSQAGAGTGDFLTKWGSFGNGESQFSFPYAVRSDKNGFVYVADSSNFRVQKFRIANDPPRCDSAEPTDGILWPPNHRFASVGIVGVTDPDGDDVTITVTGVAQDEPLDGVADGSTSPDAMFQDSDVVLRKERGGLGNGRVYTVRFTADDGNGGTCTGTVSVCVPRDRRKPVGCIDDGEIYNSP